jgi:hypothetical protein
MRRVHGDPEQLSRAVDPAVGDPLFPDEDAADVPVLAHERLVVCAGVDDPISSDDAMSLL